jgi:hypothetical protein
MTAFAQVPKQGVICRGWVLVVTPHSTGHRALERAAIGAAAR